MALERIEAGAECDWNPLAHGEPGGDLARLRRDLITKGERLFDLDLAAPRPDPGTHLPPVRDPHHQPAAAARQVFDALRNMPVTLFDERYGIWRKAQRDLDFAAPT